MKRAPFPLLAHLSFVLAAALAHAAPPTAASTKAPVAKAPVATWAPVVAPRPATRPAPAAPRPAPAVTRSAPTAAPLAPAPIVTAPIVEGPEARPSALLGPPAAPATGDAVAAYAPNPPIVDNAAAPVAAAAVAAEAPAVDAAAVDDAAGGAVVDAAPAEVDAAPVVDDNDPRPDPHPQPLSQGERGARGAEEGVDVAPVAAPVAAAPVAAPAPTAEAPAATIDAAAPLGVVAEAAPPPSSTPSPLKLLFFADAYANYQSSEPGTAVPWHRAFDSAAFGSGSQNGFSLAWTGLDVSYAGTGWGASTSLRFGPAVPQFYAADIGPVGIENILQAYVTWAPMEQLTLDLGQFGTPFGAEVAESWRNKNYTRGGLYYGMQPFWHTGARATALFSDNWKAVVFVANGTNNSLLAGNSPNVGAQVTYTSPTFTLAAGTLQAIDAATNASGFDRFFDVVATLSLDRFTAILNADYNVNATDALGVTGTSFGGVSLTAAYQLTDSFGMAVRGEALSDFDNALYQVQKVDGRVDITTGTLTLDYKPIPNSSNIVLRWDNRAEWSNQAAYFDGGGNAAQLWFTSVLGLVATTDGLF